jgi:hypothetical protein
LVLSAGILTALAARTLSTGPAGTLSTRSALATWPTGVLAVLAVGGLTTRPTLAILPTWLAVSTRAARTEGQFAALKAFLYIDQPLVGFFLGQAAVFNGLLQPLGDVIEDHLLQVDAGFFGQFFNRLPGLEGSTEFFLCHAKRLGDRVGAFGAVAVTLTTRPTRTLLVTLLAVGPTLLTVGACLLAILALRRGLSIRTTGLAFLKAVRRLGDCRLGGILGSILDCIGQCAGLDWHAVAGSQYQERHQS